MRSGKEIRDGFRRFFQQRGHELVASGPLVPANDPTLMFTNAGMVPFKQAFTGAEKRSYTRATSAQKCIRISGKHNDLENVGVTARHHTFFEMLGNFSFGDYFKEDAIRFAWDFIHGEMGLPKSHLIVTVFGGEGELPADTEAETLWRDISGLPRERILRCDAADNFWQMGDTGPCGPSSEIHYYVGDGEPDPERFGEEPDAAGRGWVELWNLVFMQFDRQANGRLDALPAPCIDTGAGLERLAAVQQGVLSNYDTDLLRPLVELAAEICGKTYGGTQGADDISMRVIADHARMAAFLIAEGIFPDRDGRPYVLRRVMRRAIRHAHRLGIEEPFMHRCALRVVDLMGEEYGELRERRALVEDVTRQEEERFRRTLRRGLERLESFDFGGKRVLPGAMAFELYDTFGFPVDLQDVIGQEQGFEVDHPGFEQELQRARERSAGSKVGEAAVSDAHRTLDQELPAVEFLGYAQDEADAQLTALLRKGESVERLEEGQAGEVVTERTPFYAEAGGQVGDQGRIRTENGVFEVEDTQKPVGGLVVHRGKVVEGTLAKGASARLQVDRALRGATRRNHSATHLLHLALRKVVGEQAMQKGSLVGPDRLRFDYSASKPLQPEEIRRIEELVNERVLWNQDVVTEVLPMDEAKKKGAIGIFEEKYGDVVRTLHIADSLELCGGTHVARTGDIGMFKILSDGGLAAGVRRIEAATGLNALRYTRELEQELERTAALVKGGPMQVHEKVDKLVQRTKDLQREIDKLKRQLVSGGSRDLTADARRIDGVNVLGARVEIGDSKAMRELADKLRDKLAPSVVVLGSATQEGKALLVCTVSKELSKSLKAGDLIREVAQVVGGGGGGRPDFAQAGGPDASKLDAAVERVYGLVEAAQAS